MDVLVIALGPALAAGMAVQQLLDLLDPLLTRALPDVVNKRIVYGLLALATGMALSLAAGLHTLTPLAAAGGQGAIPGPVDALATGLLVSGGSEGANSTFKLLTYLKENQKPPTTT